MANQKFIKTMAWVTAFSCLTRALAFAFKIYISRLLGAEILGLFQIGLSLFMLLACFSATGLPLTLSRKTAEYTVLGDDRRARQIFTSTLLTALITSGAFVLFFYAFPGVLNLIFADPRTARMFLFMLPALITTSVYSVSRAWFWGKKDYLVFSTTETLDEILKIAFAAFFISSIFTFPREIGLAIAFVAADVICAIVLLVVFFSKKGRFARPAHFPEIIKASAPITGTRILSSFTTSLTALLLPVLLVSYGMTISGATAAYGRASGMVMPIIFAPNSLIGALSVVLLPELAQLRVKGEEKKLNSAINNALLAACFIGCAFFAVYFATGQELGVLLYNDVFAGQFIVTAALLTVPMSLNNISLTSLNTLGHEDKGFISNLIGLVALAAATLSLARPIGIYAYFAGLFAYHFVTLGINFAFLKKYAKVSLPALKKMPLMLVVSAAALAAGLGVHAYVADALSNLLTILAVTSTVLLTYTAAALVLGLINFRQWFSTKRRQSAA